MRPDFSAFSAPVVTARPARAPQKSSGQQAEKQVDYTGLDILEQIERVLDEKLYTHHFVRASQKWQCKCPFPGCTSTTDSFLLWVGREVLDEGQMHYHCTHCRRKGDLINFYRDYREATTGERPTWKEAARFFGINTRTWKVDGQGEQESPYAAERRQEAEHQHQATQAEIALLGAAYRRARAWLATGQITLKDGRTISLDRARAYLQERGFSLEQASLLGLAYIPTAQEWPEIAGDELLAPWRGRILFPLTGPKGFSGYAGRSLHRWEPGMSAEQHKKVLDAWNETRRKQGKRTVERHWKTHIPAYYGYEEASWCRTLIIVEGEFDAASVGLAISDVPDTAVGAFGKEFQARQVPLHVRRVILALDTDQAGQIAIARQQDALERRGFAVAVARPPVGKDWNDCHIQAGIDVIRATIVGCLQPEKNRDFPRTAAKSDAGQVDPSAGYDLCLTCGQQVEDRDGAFVIDDQGDLYCMACWRQSQRSADLQTDAPADQASDQGAVLDRVQALAGGIGEPCTITLYHAGIEVARYRAGQQESDQDKPGAFSAGSTHCPKHHKPLVHGDEMGGRYCDHTDCWVRYRLIRAGAKRGYPEVIEVDAKWCHLPDTSQEPLSYLDVPGRQDRLPIYPCRAPVATTLIASGADAWRAFVAGQCYQDIDRAIKALA